MLGHVGGDDWLWLELDSMYHLAIGTEGAGSAT